MPSWKDYDQEQRKKSDDIFIQIGLARKALSPTKIKQALGKQAQLAEMGNGLPIGQILLKLRLIKIEDFVKINEKAKKSTWICKACTTMHSVEEELQGSCSVCGFEQEEDKNPAATTLLGAYEIIEKIAQGGMGVVYKARHLHLHRIVALKVLHREMENSPDMAERFRREWELASSLDHPNIVKVLDAGIVDGKHFLTMEYIEGSPLSEILSSRKMDPFESIKIVSELARALSYAHTQGIIHRDIKPANILIDENLHPSLTDFGIAKALHQASDLTKTGMAVGTLYYMSPEQARGESKKIDPRSDLYSLGVVLYQMLSGRVPFEGETYMEVLSKIKDELPPSLTRTMAHIDPNLEQICLKALAKDREDRYVSGEEFARDLDGYWDGKTSLALIESRRARRKKILQGAVIFVILFFAIYFLAEKLFEKNHLPPTPPKPVVVKKPKIDWEKRKKLYRIYFTSGCSFLYTKNYYTSLGYFSRALKLFEKNPPTKPPLGPGYLLRGLVFQILKRRVDAQNDYTKAMAEDPSLGEAYFYRATLFAMLDKKKDAKEDYRRSLQLSPFLRLSGNLMEGLKNWDENLTNQKLYWSLKNRRIYRGKTGPGFPKGPVIHRTRHFYWKVAYRPVWEVNWSYDFAEKVYEKVEKYLGLRPYFPAFAVVLERSPRNILGYTESGFGEIRYFAGHWLPFYGSMELIIQTTITQFLYTSISKDWPMDWWESQYGAFHALLTVRILKELHLDQIANRVHQSRLEDPLYRLFSRWTKENGWGIWRQFFKGLLRDKISFYDMARKHPWRVRSLYLVAYLALVLGKNPTAQLRQARLGQKPYWWHRKWPKKEFWEFRGQLPRAFQNEFERERPSKALQKKLGTLGIPISSKARISSWEKGWKITGAKGVFFVKQKGSKLHLYSQGYKISFREVEEVLKVRKELDRAQKLARGKHLDLLRQGADQFSQGSYKKAHKILRIFFQKIGKKKAE